MKVTHLLRFVLVVLAGQFLFSCNTAQYYRFSASTPDTYSKAKAKAATDTAPTTVEDMVAMTPEVPAAPTEEVTLEASTTAPTPVLFEREVLKAAELPAAIEPEAAVQKTAAFDEAAALAKATERLAHMGKAEKRELKRELKKAAEAQAEVGTAVKIVLSFLLPPLAVALHEGITTRFWISILLTLLFWIPGIVYALLVVTDTI